MASSRARRSLCARLATMGFDESACARRLGTWPPRNLLRPLEAHRLMGERASAQPRASEAANPLDVAMALFLFQVPVAEAVAVRALDAATISALDEMDVLARDAGSIRASVALVPVRGLLLATDGRVEIPGLNRVMPLFAESWDLAALTIRQPIETALDLCTGSGIHALLASRHAGRALAVDVSPRAVAFTRFNAWLNGIDNVEAAEGDLFAPVSEERKFALITANPPYNPEVSVPAGTDYASGGESGEEILERIVTEAPRRLVPGGYAQVITLLCHRRNEPADVRLERWLVESGTGVDALLLARPVTYRAEVLSCPPDHPTLSAQRRSWHSLGIESFEFGLLTLRRRGSGTGVRLRRGPFGTALHGPPLDALAPFLDQPESSWSKQSRSAD